MRYKTIWTSGGRTMRIVLAVALAAAISMPTLAFGAEAGGEKAKRKICKEITRTGSHLPPTRICKTRAEWEELALRNSIGGPPGRITSGDKVFGTNDKIPSAN
jgi:hypothetical protein